MKTRKHKLLDFSLLILFLLALGGLGFGVYHYFGPGPEGAVEAAALEEADLVLYLNIRDLETSAFSRALDRPDEVVPPEVARFQNALGIREEDVLEVLFSVGDIGAFAENRPHEVSMAGAVRLAAALDLDRMEAAVRETLEEGDRNRLERTEIEGRDVLNFPVPDSPLLFAATVFDRGDNGTTVYFGDENALRDTLRKLDSRREKHLPAGIREGRESIENGDHGWLVVTLNDRMQAQLREGLAASPVQLGPAGEALASLRNAGIGVRANRTLALQLVFGFGSAGDADTIRDALNENFLPLLQMMAAQQVERPPAFLEDLRARTHDATLSFSFSLSAEDIKSVQDAVPQPPQPPLTGEAADTPRDPAETGRTAAPERTPTEDGSWPRLTIEAVLMENREAVINGSVIAEREEIEGVILYEVEPRGVILRRNREYRFVPVGETVEPDN